MTPIEIQVSDAESTSDVVVSVVDDVTIAEVFDALTLPPGATIDGATVPSPASTPARTVLRSGSELSAVRGSGSTTPTTGFIDVAVVAGLDASAAARLGAGLFHLAMASKPGDAGWFVQVDKREPALGHPRPWQQHGDSTEVIGKQVTPMLALSRPIDPEPAPRGDGATPTAIHRPPRQSPTLAPASVVIGDVPTEPREPSPLSWATLLAPIPIALMMAIFFRPIFALFAAMGPVMALGRWWESRRRYRRASADRDRVIAELRQRVQRQIDAQSEAAARGLWYNNPHVGVLRQRASQGSARLWQRRPASEGFMTAMLGVGPSTWAIDLADGACPPEIRDLVAYPAPMRPVPHIVDLASERAVGVCGDRSHTLAVARSLVAQLATAHGPADLRIGVLCDPETAPDWDWLKWLPHVDRSLVAHCADAIAAGLSSVSSGETDIVRLLVVDAPGADVASLVRTAHEHDLDVRVVAVALESTVLPAVCTAVVHVTETDLVVSDDVLAEQSPRVVPTGISAMTADRWGRSLATWRDPEVTALTAAGHRMPSFLDMIGYYTASDLVHRWARGHGHAPPVVTLGSGPTGPFQIDLTADGPHALIAGTTGSGKSELLRTLVVGLAAECSPEHLNLVLVDFKGGGAFDVVSDLPHVVGLITDLDEALVTRALVSLRAELERRERLFRDLAVSTFEQAADLATEPLARLVLVIDEFAALATDYSELMSAIIDLAARGRSLGMHLVLATQRPSGVVDQKIRANTNIRIALRVQDAFDSQDVVGTPDAAQIDRKAPGSAIVRIGGDRPVAVHMAFTGGASAKGQRCMVRPHRLFGDAPEAGAEDAGPANCETELQVLVGAIVQASTDHDVVARRLWAPPLPEHLDWIDLGARELASPPSGIGFALGLADIPERQCQFPWRWDPADGALGIYGASGPSAGKALVSLGAAMASAIPPGALHLYVIDGGAGTSSALATLPHTGACIRSYEIDRVDRVVRLFESTIAERRLGVTTGAPQLVLLIDNLASVLAEHDDAQASVLNDRLAAVARDGAALGAHLVVAARTPREITHRLAQQIPNRLVMELADPNGFLALGLRLRDVVPLPLMRAMDVRTQHVVQLVEPPDLSSLACTSASTQRVAPPVNSFPVAVGLSDIEPAAVFDDGTLVIPVGIESGDLGQAELLLRPGEHALIAGAPGLGRTTAAAMIARQLSGDTHQVDVVHVVASDNTSDDTESLQALATTKRVTVLIVDDAESLSAPRAQTMEQLLDANNAHLHIIATTTLDAARSLRSWTARVRASGTGILIGGAASDGEIFRVRLADLAGRGRLPGRACLVSRGRVLGVQLACPNAGP